MGPAPRESWPVAADGGFAMVLEALELDALLASADDKE